MFDKRLFLEKFLKIRLLAAHTMCPRVLRASPPPASLRPVRSDGHGVEVHLPSGGMDRLLALHRSQGRESLLSGLCSHG